MSSNFLRVVETMLDNKQITQEQYDKMVDEYQKNPDEWNKKGRVCLK